MDLRDLLLREQDVRAVHALQPLPCGRFLYLIETPFLTFPKFAVGSTNAHNDHVEVHLKCGAMWAAHDRFFEILKAGGVP